MNKTELKQLIKEVIKGSLSEDLSKALPTIAARNVERNNLINADIEDMMDMVGDAGKGENSEEAQILFRASNASAELENALTDLQMSFEPRLDEALDKFSGKQNPNTLNDILRVLGGTLPEVDPEGDNVGTVGEMQIILKYLVKAASLGKVRGMNLNQFNSFLRRELELALNS